MRVLIFGAVHTAQPLGQMAQQCGFDVTVIDPRAAFASTARFPDVTLIREWPEQALLQLPIDQRTAVVTLTHDPKLDDPALLAALRSEAFYVGALGSGKTHASRLRRLAEQACSAERLAFTVRSGCASARAPGRDCAILGQLISVLRRERE